VDPSIRYARENDLIWDIEIDDKIERVSLFSKTHPSPNSEIKENVKADRVTLTGDVNQGVFPGLSSEGSHLISNAGQGESV
jgi:hypothetical protein